MIVSVTSITSSEDDCLSLLDLGNYVFIDSFHQPTNAQ